MKFIHMIQENGSIVNPLVTRMGGISSECGPPPLFQEPRLPFPELTSYNGRAKALGYFKSSRREKIERKKIGSYQ
jgi:hypothetical protein